MPNPGPDAFGFSEEYPEIGSKRVRAFADAEEYLSLQKVYPFNEAKLFLAL